MAGDVSPVAMFVCILILVLYCCCLYHLVGHSVLKGGGSEKVSILGEPMVLSCQFGSENRRSKWSPSIFGLFAHFYGQKLPQKAINEAYWAISRPGGSNLADPGGSRLDLGGIHPGGCVTAF